MSQVTRKEIRERIKEIISEKVPEFTRGGEVFVFSNRMKPMWEVELPAANIYTKRENAELYGNGPREYKRTLEIYIDVVVKANSKTDDILDALTRKVEIAFFADETLGDLVSDSFYLDTEIELGGEEGRVEYAVARMTFSVIYYTLAPGDEALAGLNPFKLAHAEWFPNGADENSPETVDDVELEQPPEEGDGDNGDN